MFQDLARSAREVYGVDPNAVVQEAYRAMLAVADAGMTSDSDTDDDMQLAISGHIADWMQRERQGAYPDSAQREHIRSFVDLLIAELWNHRLGRSAAMAREQQREILLAIKATLGVLESRPVGRPSQGRSERIQAMVPEDLLVWVNGQRMPQETMSDVVNRLLHEKMMGS